MGRPCFRCCVGMKQSQKKSKIKPFSHLSIFILSAGFNNVFPSFICERQLCARNWCLECQERTKMHRKSIITSSLLMRVIRFANMLRKRAFLFAKFFGHMKKSGNTDHFFFFFFIHVAIIVQDCYCTFVFVAFWTAMCGVLCAAFWLGDPTLSRVCRLNTSVFKAFCVKKKGVLLC